MIQTYPYSPIPVNYSFSSFLPYLTEEVLYFHYNKVYKNVIKELNALIQEYPALETWNLTDCITADLGQLTGLIPTVSAERLQHYAGSVYNHDIFFPSLNNKSPMAPHGNLKKAIESSYGTVRNFQNLFASAAKSILGSGWVWLNSEGNGKVHISVSKDCQTPDLNLVTPILGVDMWEHAFFSQYSTNTGPYINNWFVIFDWNWAEARFNASLNSTL